ncbi:MAG: rRNA maturation RNase YbeY [Saprospiraceae bacterium]|nr:rRNA maturation RNase YbeY [Saprospiraceae bacterium]MBK9222348.1 rRNA maturation RNase YbeY [Saprospiraceae bacterium]MBK9723026.1 rRNA maturation RNase YbeY [Saprospiraceae bacterium]
MKNKPNIEFHFNVEAFDFNQRKVSQWIEKVIHQYQMKAGIIGVIFCDDRYLRNMNNKFLQHDYFTDILSFPLSKDPIEGELYISIDRVRENAKKFKVDEEWELLRVIIHGILHFIGYQDKTAKDIKEMRGAEDHALALYKDEFIKQEHYFDLVYDVVRCIPIGKVCSYGAIADYLSLGSARMVGWALNQLKGNVMNVPAHRVVNVKGELSGRLMFGDSGNRMEELLKAEGVPIKNHKVEKLELYFWSPLLLNHE